MEGNIGRNRTVSVKKQRIKTRRGGVRELKKKKRKYVLVEKGEGKCDEGDYWRGKTQAPP